MSNYNRDLTVLLHMQKYCSELSDVFDEYGKDYDTFKGNSIYRNAISMALFQISELSSHLTPEFRDKNSSEINWVQIKGMRNRFAHEYEIMNLKAIY